MNGSVNRHDACIVAAFPLVLAVGVLLIPVVPDYSDHDAAARAAQAAVRWFAGHTLSAVAFGFSVAAATVLARHAESAGAVRQGRLALPLMTIGAALHAAGLGADGVGPLAHAAAGSSAAVFFDGSAAWVPPLFIAGSVVFGAGQLVLMLGLARCVGRRRGTVLVVSAAVFSVAEAIPSGRGLYIVAAAGLVIYLSLSHVLWRGVSYREPEAGRQPAGRPVRP